MSPRSARPARLRRYLAATALLASACVVGAEHADLGVAVARSIDSVLVARAVCATAAACQRAPHAYWSAGWGDVVHVSVRRVADTAAARDIEARARQIVAGHPGWRVELAFYRDFRDGGPQGAFAWPTRRVTLRAP